MIVFERLLLSWYRLVANMGRQSRSAALVAILLASVSIAAIPPAAQLYAPTGEVSTARPEFSWGGAASATWYQIWINGNGSPCASG